jgi:putative PIN family toxin of toxin-antitoxin system
MPKVVLDTNAFISAILTPGQSRRVVEMARKGTIDLAVSEAILGEIERVLRLKLRRADWEIDAVLRGIRDISIFVSPGHRLSVIEADDADNRILECAVEAKAEYIVTGDAHHLLPLKEFQGIRMLSPGEFCKLSQMEPHD